MFKRKYRVSYHFDNKKPPFLTRETLRVPQIGKVILVCYGEWLLKVLNVTTIEMHDADKNGYCVLVERLN